MSSRMKRYFAVCGIVFVIGLALAIVGAACGGEKGLEKLADKYDWIQGSPGERSVHMNSVEDFDQVKVTGDMDVFFVGPKHYNDKEWMEEHDLLLPEETERAEGCRTCVIIGKNATMPEIKSENGVLTIAAGPQSVDGISFNTGEGVWQPKVIVFCPDKALRDVSVSGEAGDVVFRGVAVEKGFVTLNSGDVDMEESMAKDLTIDVEAGDVELEGDFNGPTKINSDAGDVELEGSFNGATTVTADAGDVKLVTPLAKNQYSLDLSVPAGDLEITMPGEPKAEMDCPGTVHYDGSPNNMNIKASAGDVELVFGAK